MAWRWLSCLRLAVSFIACDRLREHSVNAKMCFLFVCSSGGRKENKPSVWVWTQVDRHQSPTAASEWNYTSFQSDSRTPTLECCNSFESLDSHQPCFLATLFKLVEPFDAALRPTGGIQLHLGVSFRRCLNNLAMICLRSISIFWRDWKAPHAL